MAAGPLSWSDLEALAGSSPLGCGQDRSNGATNAQADWRLFGHSQGEVRVTLFRDHHAWCPYCQKVWLWLEERRIPYRVRKVTMFCYGEKESWYKRLVPSGMLPALELDGVIVTESDAILQALEQSFGSLGAGMADPAVLPLRQLERQLFRAWCQWLCRAHRPDSDADAQGTFQRWAGAMEQALTARPGDFLLGPELGTADLVFVPYVERMNASLAYYKGYLLRQNHPAIDRWFRALEQRPTYLGCQSDFHTHAHDLPPQMGGCYASGSDSQRQLAHRIDHGPWPIVAGAWGRSRNQPAPARRCRRRRPGPGAAPSRHPAAAQPPWSRSLCPAPAHGPGQPGDVNGVGAPGRQRRWPAPAARSHQRAAGHAPPFRPPAAPGPGAHRQPRSAHPPGPGGRHPRAPPPRPGSATVPGGRI